MIIGFHLAAMMLGAETPPRPAASEGEAIVITGARLRHTRVDYQRSRGRVSHRQAGRNETDKEGVRIVCRIVRECVKRGASNLEQVQSCVDAVLIRLDEADEQ